MYDSSNSEPPYGLGPIRAALNAPMLMFGFTT